MTRVSVNELILSDESGFACSKSKLVEVGLPHLRPFNISDAGNLDLSEVYQVPAGESPRGKTSLEEGDILFNNTNSAELVGKSAIIGSPMTAGFSNHMTRIKVDKARVEPAYFGYWLRRLRSTGYFTAHATQWVSQAAFKSSELRKLDLELSPLPEQRRIVDLLSRAEGIVRLRREAEKIAAELIPALFLDMFGDPATNPKGWPVVSLGEAIESAEYGSSTKASSDKAGLPLIRMGNVDYAGNLDLGDLKYVELSDEEVEKYRLQAGDILFNRTNSKELVGKTGLWDGSCEAVAASYFIRVRVKRGSLNPFYLWAFMNSAHMKKVLFETARGAIGQANINARELRAFKMPLPFILGQDGFEKRCQDVAGLVSQQSTATAKAQAAFDALLSSVFSH